MRVAKFLTLLVAPTALVTAALKVTMIVSPPSGQSSFPAALTNALLLRYAIANATTRLPPMPVQPADTLRYGVGTWEPDSLGNHRAVVRVANAADAVFAHIPWRRRDMTPDKVNVVVMNAATNQRVLNVARVNVNREFGDIVFQAPSAGIYFLYYMPYTGTFKSNYPKITYRVVEKTADATWVSKNSLTSGNAYQSLPHAQMIGFDAVNDFSKFTPMEYIATAAEVSQLRAANSSAPFLAFAEDRSRSIRMTSDIPQLWAERGAFKPFSGTAKRGEYYTFQIGVWANRSALDSVRYVASALKRRGGAESIPASAITSFNTEGTDWSGKRFTRTVHVDAGKVQPLWFGVNIPASAVAGDYEGQITVLNAGQSEQIHVQLKVLPTIATNHGDDSPAQLTRLRWLNSQLAADDGIVAPYTAMRVVGNTISLLGRSFTFGNDGLPTSIRSYFNANNSAIGATSREILSAPVRLQLSDADNHDVVWTGAAPAITKRASGAVAWDTRKIAGALRLHSQASLEFDGTAEYSVAIHASKRTTISNVRFEIPMRADAAKYMMGLGQKGGYRPEDFHWKWDVAKKNQDAAWIGDVNAGLQFTLKDEHYVRPLNTNFYLSKPLIEPKSWGNGGKGGCDITRASRADRVLVSCYSGSHTIEAGDSLHFDFRLMITPFKPLDTKGQFNTRYFHAFVPVDSIVKRGANTVNVHHATRINPWINYPFLEPAAMRSYIDSTHARGLKTKIYYTVRELTDHAPEIFALRSLGDEVLSHGPGGGFSWLQEHLGDDYIAAWHVPEIKDAAVVNSGVSRWHNFYIEGLDWLVKNERIDGLYLDDVAFDRLTMKRVRKVLDRGNPGALLDLHSANQYNPRDGYASSANLYLEHFPFLNRLWFGEYFDYDSRPDYWLVEISGIPFGLMGEMLEKGGNPWRGMTMGMTARLPWAGDPTPIWKAWDDFGIQQSQMHGWWSGRDPVTTSDSAVLATTWTKPGSAMISLGSWYDDDVNVKLKIDWKALGIDSTRAQLRAPAIDKFQDAATWAPGASIPVPGKKGLILIVEQKK
ncbi:MAG: glycoside hydrolase domain-containing protein [Gemmatimonadaceae bacterium]